MRTRSTSELRSRPRASVLDAGSSWAREEVVLQQVGHAPGPGFVGIAANVDAMDERHFFGPDVGHVHVDVEDEIRDFLDHDPGDVISAELFAVGELAATAGADLGTGSNFARGLRRYGDELISAGGFELCFEDDAINAMRARSASVVGSRSPWSLRNSTLSKATLLAGSDGVSVAAEQTPSASAPKMSNAASPHAASGVRAGQSRGPRPA